MNQTKYRTYDELPLVLKADDVAKTLNISRTYAYALFHRQDFPSLQIGNRMLVPRDRFLKWIEDNTQ